jgi:hypothetical protein
VIGRDHNNPLCTDEETLDLVNSLQRVMKYLESTGSASGNAKLPVSDWLGSLYILPRFPTDSATLAPPSSSSARSKRSSS